VVARGQIVDHPFVHVSRDVPDHTPRREHVDTLLTEVCVCSIAASRIAGLVARIGEIADGKRRIRIHIAVTAIDRARTNDAPTPVLGYELDVSCERLPLCVARKTDPSAERATRRGRSVARDVACRYP